MGATGLNQDFSDDGRTARYKKSGEKQTTHPIKTKAARRHAGQTDHEKGCKRGGHQYRQAELAQTFETEVEPDSEHQENHPKLGENRHAFLVFNEPSPERMGANNHASHQISYNRGDTDAFTNDTGYRCRQHDDRNILNEKNRLSHNCFLPVSGMTRKRMQWNPGRMGA